MDGFLFESISEGPNGTKTEIYTRDARSDPPKKMAPLGETHYTKKSDSEALSICGNEQSRTVVSNRPVLRHSWEIQLLIITYF